MLACKHPTGCTKAVVTVYRLDISPLCDSSLFEYCRSMCTPLRQKKAENKAMENDKRLCVGTGFLLSRAAADFSLSPDLFSENTNGKLSLNGRDLFFSISHSGKYAVVAFSEIQCGIDIEKSRCLPKNLFRRCLTSNEKKLVGFSDDANAYFLKLWTRKEALFKASQKESISKTFSADVSSENITFFDNNYFFDTLCFDNHTLSICSKEAPFSVSLIDISI